MNNKNYKNSRRIYEKAKTLMPGGVNSPVRAFKSVDQNPVFIERGKGAIVWDIDGNEYIDYVMSWGPLILGHAPPNVVSKVKLALEKGFSFGAPTEIEVRLAELIIKSVPSIEVLRMVNSGTEATMSAIRVARAYTGKAKIIKFEGCYHGHADSFLIKAGSGATTFGTPSSPGVPESLASETLCATFNDIDSVKKLISENKREIAALILEPVAGNMGVIPPKDEFLQQIRDLTLENNILLIFDEVITGFRLSSGGAQKLYGVNPDLTTLGKIIGGGFPVGAYGGKREIMNMISPDGPVYQAGTLSGNPIAMTAGYETLKYILSKDNFYETLEKMGRLLEEGIKDALKKLNITLTYNRVGSMGTLFFTEKPVQDYPGALASDTRAFSSYFKEMLLRGVYLAPSQFEANFLSSEHNDKMIEKTISAMYESLKTLYN